MKTYQLVLGALVVVGCSGRAIDVGPGGGDAGNDNPGGAAGGSAVSVGTGGTASAAQGGANALPAALACTDTTPLPTWPSATDCVANSDLPLVGTWTGYAEGAAVASPWSMLTLLINGASVSGGLCGTLTLGTATGAPPPAATDPSVTLPGLSPIDLSDFTPGTTLTLVNGTTDGTRVQFGVTPVELYRGWCALQPSYGNEPSTGADCTCLPDWPGMGYAPSDSPLSGVCTLIDPNHVHNLTVNCGLTYLCFGSGNPCTCNEAGCDAQPGETFHFDLRFAASSADGSSITGVTSSHTIFTRVQ